MVVPAIQAAVLVGVTPPQFGLPPAQIWPNSLSLPSTSNSLSTGGKSSGLDAMPGSIKAR